MKKSECSRDASLALKNKLLQLINQCMCADRFSFSRRLHKIKFTSELKNHPETHKLGQLITAIDQSVHRCQSRLDDIPHLFFPDDLPVCQNKEEISTAINSNQLIILCGETGSGKTTQLAKICIQLGRGSAGIIGHTQPRRIAARSVAMRIADEMHVTLGQLVGYKIRFNDKTQADTRVKLMTDGILLAEIQQDKFLNQYDTLIIDEAHERSLNIDFLLGYIKIILVKRPDLKVIITSATINAGKLSKYFFSAPVINVSGRGYPIEIRYQATDEIDDDIQDSQFQAKIIHAVDELSRHGPGDMLIFLPGEREIRETTETLRKHHPTGVEILPLYSRLSASEQQKIFTPHAGRRIVLATNVAETSLTVPGICYVIDPGIVRLSRYSYRSKIQRLPLEKISQASANQRAGRCGRTGPGVCIRLYSEDDFLNRPAFTDPEILRSNLAGVILQMKAGNLGDIEKYPFIDAPDSRFIRAGYRLLEELGAIPSCTGSESDSRAKLTKIGKQLANLPVDPKLARIIIAADKEQCMSEVLVIAAALTVQDPRERPLASRSAADQAHRGFNDKHSDFISYLNLWRDYQHQYKHLSQNKLRKYCREHFLSFVRLREWRDIYRQLLSLVKGMGFQLNTQNADYDAIHRALLTGFVSHIARLHDEKEYRGPRNSRPLIFPGSVLSRSKPKWIVAAEFVETSQLYARVVAKIDPVWIEEAAPHLLRREYYNPHWSKSRGQVAAYERLRMFGLVINEKKRVNYGKISVVESREIFIREAMVEGQYDTQAVFMLHNRKFLESLEEQQHKNRRHHQTIDAYWLFDFYDKNIASEIVDIRSFEKWYRVHSQDNKELLFISVDQEDINVADRNKSDTDFPDQLIINKLALKLRYHFSPGAVDDGVAIDLPLAMLGQFNSSDFDWIVPGLLEEKIIALIRSLPKVIRKHCVPATNYASACLQAIDHNKGSLLESLAQQLTRINGIEITVRDWRLERLPAHCLMYFRIIDNNNEIVGEGRDLESLQSGHAQSSHVQFNQLPFSQFERDNLYSWDFDELPDTREINIDGLLVTVYPALLKDSAGIHLRVFDAKDKAHSENIKGVRALALINLQHNIKWIKKNIQEKQTLCLHYISLGSCDELINSTIAVVVDALLLEQGALPRNRQSFNNILKITKSKITEQSFSLFTLLDQSLERYQKINKHLKSLTSPDLLASLLDMRQHLNKLIYKGFVNQAPLLYLQQLPRYLHALELRLEKLSRNPRRDGQLYQQLLPLLQRLEQRTIEKKTAYVRGNAIENDPHWLMEELRVSLFAQELGTHLPISLKKMSARLA